MTNSHFGFRGLAVLASAPRCRPACVAAFRTRPERRIYAAGPRHELQAVQEPQMHAKGSDAELHHAAIGIFGSD